MDCLVMAWLRCAWLEGFGMTNASDRRPVDDLLDLLLIEERAKSCSTRAQARLLIKEADQVKRALWGSQAESVNPHF